MPDLKIRNWEKWQSYRKDRGQPPWIKLHREVMRNPDWVTMTDAQRGQLVAIWLLAADRGGEIPAESSIVKKLCYMDSEPDLKLFMDKGFIDHDARVTPTRRQHDAPETETETETERECVKPNGSTLPPRFEDFWKHWPVKRNKQKAKNAWKAKKLDESADDLITDVENRMKYDRQWKAGFIPHCSTYLNGHRWEDEYET